MAAFTDLEGKTLESVWYEVDDEEILFNTSCGKKYRMYHSQDCCEDVHVEDICGDLDDLIGSPIQMAEAYTKEGEEGGHEEYTFYKLATVKGYVTIRWYGWSNGYYSIEVYFEEVT